MQRLVDFLLPHNCRKELKIAAAKNKATCKETVCLLQDHRNKVLREITHGGKAA